MIPPFNTGFAPGDQIVCSAHQVAVLFTHVMRCDQEHDGGEADQADEEQEAL